MVEGGRSQIQRRRPPLPIQIPDRVLLHLERQRNLSPQSAPSNGLSPAAMAKPSHSPGPLSIHQQKKSISKILYSEEFWKDLSRGESRNGEETRGSLSGHHQCGESCSRRPRDAQLSLTRIVAECSLLLVFLLAGAGGCLHSHAKALGAGSISCFQSKRFRQKGGCYENVQAGLQQALCIFFLGESIARILPTWPLLVLSFRDQRGLINGPHSCCVSL